MVRTLPLIEGLIGLILLVLAFHISSEFTKTILLILGGGLVGWATQ